MSRTRGREPACVRDPRDRGRRRQVFAFDAPGGLRLERSELAASAQRAAVTITLVRSSRDNIGATLAFAGPVAGGWSELPPFTEPRSTPSPLYINSLQVDGERIITLETRGRVRRPARRGARSRSPRGRVRDRRRGDGRDLRRRSRRLSRTRRRRVGRRSELRRRARRARLAHRGRAESPPTCRTTSARSRCAPMAASPRPPTTARCTRCARVRRRGCSPVAAARWPTRVTRWSTSSGDGLRVIEPSGRIRRFGAPTASLYGFATDGSRVVWVANGCLLVDDVSAPPAAAPGPGPCARSELALPAQPGPHLARTLPVVLRCVAAPRACRGTLRLTTAEDGNAGAREGDQPAGALLDPRRARPPRPRAADRPRVPAPAPQRRARQRRQRTAARRDRHPRRAYRRRRALPGRVEARRRADPRPQLMVCRRTGHDSCDGVPEPSGGRSIARPATLKR